MQEVVLKKSREVREGVGEGPGTKPGLSTFADPAQGGTEGRPGRCGICGKSSDRALGALALTRFDTLSRSCPFVPIRGSLIAE